MPTASSGAESMRPLSDPEAVQSALDALPASDPVVVLEELTRWLRSLCGARGSSLDRRIETLLAIDSGAQPSVSRLESEYVAAARPSSATESRMWGAIYGYWTQAGEVCARALEEAAPSPSDAQAVRALRPALIVRTLRCLAQRIKWTHLRYGPIEASAWSAFNRAYALAESWRLTDEPAACPGEPGGSTPRREFLRGAMLSAISPDSLSPEAIELAERLIAAHAERFALTPSPAPDLPYWTDLDKAMAPQRLLHAPPPAPGLRCFGAGAALEDLTELGRKLDTTGPVPLARVGLGFDADPRTLLEVLRHLATHWTQQPPQRRHMRHVARARLTVAHGFEGVLRALLGRGAADSAGRDMESWVVEDVSVGGIGASVPRIDGDWLRVGALLALQPEGAGNWVIGVVRRLGRASAQQARVGIQTLSRTPIVAEFSREGPGERGVLLKSGDPRTGEALIALRPGVFASGDELRAVRGGEPWRYLPQGIAERAADYELAFFRELADES